MRSKLMRRALALVTAGLCGCYGNALYQSNLAPGGVQSSGANVQLGTNRGVLTGIVVFTAIMADGSRRHVEMSDGGGVSYGTIPPLDPRRAIDVQDCTQAVDLTAGNLLCR